jgi:hypothetical protein
MGWTSTILCVTVCENAHVTPVAMTCSPEAAYHILEANIETRLLMCLSAVVAPATVTPPPISTHDVFEIQGCWLCRVCHSGTSFWCTGHAATSQSGVDLFLRRDYMRRTRA